MARRWIDTMQDRARRTAWTLLLATATAAPLAAQADEPLLETARSAYEAGHYRRAFDGLAVLADSGHCEAARFAREMVRHGPRLYDLHLAVAADRLARWQAVPRCDQLPATHAAVTRP